MFPFFSAHHVFIGGVFVYFPPEIRWAAGHSPPDVLGDGILQGVPHRDPRWKQQRRVLMQVLQM
jgi:hypothetical protein